MCGTGPVDMALPLPRGDGEGVLGDDPGQLRDAGRPAARGVPPLDNAAPLRPVLRHPHHGVLVIRPVGCLLPARATTL